MLSGGVPGRRHPELLMGFAGTVTECEGGVLSVVERVAVQEAKKQGGECDGDKGRLAAEGKEQAAGRVVRYFVTA